MHRPVVVPDSPVRDPSREATRRAYLADETDCLHALLPAAAADDPGAVEALARRLVERVRAHRPGGLDAFMAEYDLSSQEGVALMCVAEALLRIPDAATADALIRDKLAAADWAAHLEPGQSLFVNASTWGLMLTGRFVRLDPEAVRDVGSLLRRLAARSGEPAVRAALRQAMGIMSEQFVMGRDIESALARAARTPGYRYSFDMLGEAALTADDAARYLDAYHHAIAAIGAQWRTPEDAREAPGISIKLSALHPRFELAQRARLMEELTPRVRALALAAREAGVTVTIDTEEAERLEPTLDVFEAVHGDAALGGWDGFGLALQAYQKRAAHAVDWLADLAARHARAIPLRLVKGAYWDTEIKRAQERGLDGYPVFLRKAHTDVSYLACARRILDAGDAFFPQFATHNAHTVAAVASMAGERPFEFQRLHGMGEALYTAVTDPAVLGAPCRVYAPVGPHRDLLPYLVRRLLENGANTSFVNRIVDAQVPVDELIRDPVATARRGLGKAPARIPPPGRLYGAERANSRGLNLQDPLTLAGLARDMSAARAPVDARPLVDGIARDGEARAVTNPADRDDVVGSVTEADAAAVDAALAAAGAAQPEWDHAGGAYRAECLERAADALEAETAALMDLSVREAGRCLPDALAEVREAVDFCRYYAAQARREFAGPRFLRGPTGERNELRLHGRGVFACISPWNFPVAIFTGQVAAALAAGNAVVAKPAGPTPLVAARVVSLLHAAGVPPAVLHYLPGGGAVVGAGLARDPRVAGVAFTGSIATARSINRDLAAREAPIAALIAETGGLNAMLVDSSALPEQVVTDVLRSAFNSAGQRCSALRVLFVQDEAAPRILDMLAGAMAELRVGDPALLATDVGPVIDADARDTLAAHIARMKREARLIHACAPPPEAGNGTFVAPHAFEIERLEQLEGEVFGPVLHVVRYRIGDLDRVIDAVNATGYGLTLGIHTRIEARARHIRERMRVGNAYVNRDMIGAVVGVQPFGGEGLSGTGPKAGGPHYLHRFAVERGLAVNTAALGGNASLLAQKDDDEGPLGWCG